MANVSSKPCSYAVIVRLSWELKPGTNQLLARNGFPRKKGSQFRIATTGRGQLDVAGMYQLRRGPSTYEIRCKGYSAASSNKLRTLLAGTYNMKELVCWDLPLFTRRAVSTPTTHCYVVVNSLMHLPYKAPMIERLKLIFSHVIEIKCNFGHMALWNIRVVVVETWYDKAAL